MEEKKKNSCYSFATRSFIKNLQSKMNNEKLRITARMTCIEDISTVGR